jgi:hypothetical protein
MKRNKESISAGHSYKEIGEFWDNHDLGEHWDRTESAEFDIDIQSQSIYYAVDAGLSQEVQSIARKRGISAETLLNLWLQEKVRESHM